MSDSQISPSTIDALVTPYTTSEFHAMVEAARALHHGLHDRFVVMAAELTVGLSKVEGRRGMMGLDSKVAAQRVTRHLKHAAGYDLQAARAVVRSYQMFNELFLGKAPAARGQSFDLDK